MHLKQILKYNIIQILPASEVNIQFLILSRGYILVKVYYIFRCEAEENMINRDQNMTPRDQKLYIYRQRKAIFVISFDQQAKYLALTWISVSFLQTAVCVHFQCTKTRAMGYNRAIFPWENITFFILGTVVTWSHFNQSQISIYIGQMILWNILNMNEK